MKSENFVIIQGWMCNELELKGNDLLVFALIYGFSQDGESAFHGSRNYIANTFNISKPTVDKAIQNLLDSGYIVKYESEDFNTPNAYAVNIQVVKKLYWGSKETLLGGSKETLLNNTSKQTTKEKKNNSKELLQKQNSPTFEFGKQKPQKENLFTKCVNMIDDFTVDTQVRIDLTQYLNVLLEMRKDGYILYANVWKGLLRKLAELSKNPKEQHEIIWQSIERGYKSFFPVNSYSNNLKDKPWEKGVKSDGYTEEEKRQLEKEQQEMEARGEQVWY